jgi:hypothetical protein
LSGCGEPLEPGAEAAVYEALRREVVAGMYEALEGRLAALARRRLG